MKRPPGFKSQFDLVCKLNIKILKIFKPYEEDMYRHVSTIQILKQYLLLFYFVDATVTLFFYEQYRTTKIRCI